MICGWGLETKRCMVHRLLFSRNLEQCRQLQSMSIALTLTETFLHGLFTCRRTEYSPPSHTQRSPARPFSSPATTSLQICDQTAQVANPRLLNTIGLCFSIPFASCCSSFSLVLQAAVTTMCYEISGSDSRWEYMVPWLHCQGSKD